MPSILPDFEYDIFISYRQNDNKYDGWVTGFVDDLKMELEATVKQKLSIYFDENPHDGLLESHEVDDSLKSKLKCPIFIPIVSQTYCDPDSFAWEHEFIAFRDQASSDNFGLKVELANHNVANRILPVRIHDLDDADVNLFETELGSALRPIDFVYKEAGVNRPLKNDDDQEKNLNKTKYRNQINKVANAIKDILNGMQGASSIEVEEPENSQQPAVNASKSFSNELRRRNVFRASLVYIIMSLLVWKLTSIILNYTSIEANVLKFVTILLITFFPVAIILAWMYERSPGGFIRASSKIASDNPFTPSQKKPLTSNAYIMVLLVIVVAVYFLFPQKTGQGISSSRTIQSDNKSIAVLYFDNMSGDPEQEYFSDGITEEIITHLTKIKDLRVISRTSARTYKGQTLNVKKIAEELNVSAILEGSVRKSGNTIRVTAQLIDAGTDEHIWAETFDRQLSDIFQVQSDIARQIAEKFEVEMSSETRLQFDQIPTSNIEAYDYFQKGKHFVYKYWNERIEGQFFKAKQFFEDALVIDPNFALAYAGLAELYDTPFGLELDSIQKLKSLRNINAYKAYQLDPNSDFVNTAMLWMYLNREEPMLDSAIFHAQKALELNPNDALTNFNMSILLGGTPNSKLKLETSIPFMEKTIRLDPLDPNPYSSLIHKYYNLNRIEEAEKALESALKLKSGRTFGDAPIVFGLIRLDKLEEAEAMLENETRPWREWMRNMLLAKKGNFNEIDEDFQNNFAVALYSGKIDQCLIWAEEGIDNGVDNYNFLNTSPEIAPLRDLPDFDRVLNKAKILHDEYLEKYGHFKPID